VEKVVKVLCEVRDWTGAGVALLTLVPCFIVAGVVGGIVVAWQEAWDS
jgi:hypothetical protein